MQAPMQVRNPTEAHVGFLSKVMKNTEGLVSRTFVNQLILFYGRDLGRFLFARILRVTFLQWGDVNPFTGTPLVVVPAAYDSMEYGRGPHVVPGEAPYANVSSSDPIQLLELMFGKGASSAYNAVDWGDRTLVYELEDLGESWSEDPQDTFNPQGYNQLLPQSDSGHPPVRFLYRDSKRLVDEYYDGMKLNRHEWSYPAAFSIFDGLVTDLHPARVLFEHACPRSHATVEASERQPPR